jgi:hypothetical protein
MGAYGALFVLSFLLLSLSPASLAYSAPTTTEISVGASPAQILVSGNRAYVLHANTVTVINTSNNTVIETITTGGNLDRGVIAGDSLWVTSYANLGGAVFRINTSTFAITTFTGGRISGPSGIATDGTYVYVAMNSSDKVERFQISNNDQSDLGYNGSAAGADSPFRLAIAGNILYVFQGSSAHVVPWNLTTNTQSAAIATGTNGASNAVTDPSSSFVFFGNTEFRRLDVSNNSISTVASITPRGFDFGADGRIYVSTGTGLSVYELSSGSYDPIGTLEVTGGTQWVALVNPSTLYLSHPSGNRILVVTLDASLSMSDEILDIDTATTLSAPVAAGFWSDPVYTSTTLPLGLDLNSATGVISGTPTLVQPATQVTLTATTGMFTRTVTFTITVVDPNAPDPEPQDTTNSERNSSGTSSKKTDSVSQAPQLAATGSSMDGVAWGVWLMVAGLISLVALNRLGPRALTGEPNRRSEK